MDVIVKIIGVVSIIMFLFTFMQKVTDAMTAISAPSTLNFYFLFFWGTVAAVFGGILWGGCQRLFPGLIATPNVTSTLGGTIEPHGLAAFLWAIVTNLPPAVLLVVLSWKYGFIQPKYAAITMLILLATLGLAALVFYDLPLSGHQGFRRYMAVKQIAGQMREFYLVLVWSSLLTIIPFLAIFLANKSGFLAGPVSSLTACGTAIGLTVGLTAASVGFFIAAYPDPEFDPARGVIAGVVLRISLFLAFIVSCRP